MIFTKEATAQASLQQKEDIWTLLTINAFVASLQGPLDADQSAVRGSEQGFAKGLWRSAVSFFMRPDVGIPSEAAPTQGYVQS